MALGDKAHPDFDNFWIIEADVLHARELVDVVLASPMQGQLRTKLAL